MNAPSFRARLALTMSTSILLIATAVWIYLPGAFEEEALALIAHKGETLAQLTAFTIHPSIYFGDAAAVDEALEGTRQDKDVAYLIVVADTGQRVADLHPERATPEALQRRTAGGGVSRDGTLYEVMMPIREGERELARLFVGMSLARLRGEVAQMRVTIGVLAVGILAAGLFVIALLSNLLTRPLRALAAGAERIAAGDLGYRVSIRRQDEIGKLAESFDKMTKKVAEREASLRRSHEQLRHLSRRLLSVQEGERVRIAREVHDELGQALTAVTMDLQRLGMSEPSLREPLREIARTVDETVELVRRIAADLRPAILDDLGLTAALEQQLRRLRETTGMSTRLIAPEEPTLDTLTGTTLYRIAQEGLANVIRHAGATTVEVSFSIDDETAQLVIRDDGCGMTPEQIADARSLGLLGIRERAELLGGSVVIDGRPGHGAVLTITLPLVKEESGVAGFMRR